MNMCLITNNQRVRAVYVCACVYVCVCVCACVCVCVCVCECDNKKNLWMMIKKEKLHIVHSPTNALFTRLGKV